MSVDEQKTIWDARWAREDRIDAEKLLYSRHAGEAIRCISSFIEVNDKLILEAGCGTGKLCCLLAKNFPGSRIIGMDSSESSLRIANVLKDYIQVSNATFEIGNLFEIAYPDNHFEVVLNEGVIEHFALEDSPNYVDALREMIRVTKLGGKIIVGVPNWYCLPHTFYKWVLKKMGKPYKYGYEKSFKHKELMQLFTELGLQEVKISAFYPAHPLYRFTGRGGLAKLFSVLGKLTDLIETLDFSAHKSFSKKFGIEIVIKGLKK